jgi:uncharacterized protein (DUF3820 family)
MQSTDGMFDKEEFAQTMAEIGRTHMPFGRYGPDDFPPRGIPIYDLPPEYLQWFKEKGFPNGRLGELLEIVHEIKYTGADEVFAPFRMSKGGRSKLTPKRKKSFKFGRESDQ